MDAVIKSRYTRNGYERVKVIVTRDDGSKADWWPRYPSDKVPNDATLITQAIVRVTDQDAALLDREKNMPVDRAEVDAVVAKLKAANAITSTTWEDLVEEDVKTVIAGP